jgi:hypothetical protein
MFVSRGFDSTQHLQTTPATLANRRERALQMRRAESYQKDRRLEWADGCRESARSGVVTGREGDSR